MVRIPSEYQEVEYIESTGTQYILTDFVPKFLENEEYYMQFAYTDDRKTQIFFGGNSKYTTFQGVAIERGSPGIFGLRPSDNCSTYSGTAPFGINEWIDFFIANNTLTCKEASGTIRDTIHNNRLKLVLFGKGEETLTLSSMKLSCVYYKRDGETVLNLIPCYRKSDNEIGMYDTVSKQFYTNSGTGTFLKGNDVTYDNINLLESRRRILLNTPHIETVSDTIVSFKTDVVTKLKGCKVYFTPIQEGTGDPSPDNVRPITGWDGITLYLSGSDTSNPTTLTIPFNRTIYGGYVDLVKGEVVEEYGCKTLNGTEGWLTQAANTTYNLKFLHALGTIPINSALNKGITEYIPEYTSNNQLNKDGILCCRFGWSDRTFYVLNATEYLDGVTDITTFKSYLAEHPLKIVYKLVTPNVYPLTPQTLKALRGMNNIWSNANGNIEVSFYTH